MSNIYKVTLQASLSKKQAGIKEEELKRQLDYLIKVPAIGFLKEVKTSQGIVVVQINKSKMAEIAEHVRKNC